MKLQNLIDKSQKQMLNQYPKNTNSWLVILFMPLGFIAIKTFNYLAFDFERTWWKLLQERVVRTKFDIYVFIIHQS